MYCCKTHPNAIAVIRGNSETSQLFGKVRFYQEKKDVLIIAEVYGLPKQSKTGFFALHIHEGDSCSGENFSETGTHYDPANVTHPHHAGDLPPLMLCQNGAYLAVRTDRFRVHDVIGRTVVIHSAPDDFHSQPSGNAGIKIGCGVIRKR